MSVIVDDRNTDIVYSPPLAWQQKQGQSQEFRSTTSLPIAKGAELVFSFQGTSIQVLGTVGYGRGASVAFTLDAQTPRVFTTADNLINLRNPVFHNTFYDSGDIADGNHTLTVTAVDTSLLANFYIDYFTYAPSPNLPINNNFFFVDDKSANLNYTGDVVTTNPAADGSYMNFGNTAHGMSTGSSASLTFAGTGIQIYGTVPNTIPNGPVAAFQIDSATPKIVNSPPLSDLVGSVLSLNVVANYLWFDSGDLPAGVHTLQINSLSTGALYVDYLLLPTSGNSITAALPAPGSTSSTSSSSSASATSSSTSSSSSSSTASSSTVSPSGTSVPVSNAVSGSSNTAAIAGGVIGALAAVAILAGLIFWMVARRKKRRYRDDLEPYAFDADAKPTYKPWTEKAADPNIVTLAPQYPHLNYPGATPDHEYPSHEPPSGFQENLVTGYHDPRHALIPSPPPTQPAPVPAQVAPSTSVHKRQTLPAPLANLKSPSTVPIGLNSAIYGTSATTHRDSHNTQATNGPVYDLESIKTRQSTDMYGEEYAYAGGETSSTSHSLPQPHP